jgi:exodeoxyribonuclease VII small subunit
MTTPDQARQFEDLLQQLQQTVASLEQEQLTLSDAIAAYERAVQLANECSSMLDEAELRVREIEADSRSVREYAATYSAEQINARSLLLGDDDDLLDLLESEE